jgi:hypothetical protein
VFDGGRHLVILRCKTDCTKRSVFSSSFLIFHFVLQALMSDLTVSLSDPKVSLTDDDFIK